MSDISKMSKDELENQQVAKEAEYRLGMDTLNVVELQDLDLARQVAEIQLKRKNLATAITQGKYNIRRIASDLRSIKICIWKALGEGR